MTEIKHYDQAKALLDKGYLQGSWTLEQLAKRLAEQDKGNENRAVLEGNTVLSSKTGTPKRAISQQALDASRINHRKSEDV